MKNQNEKEISEIIEDQEELVLAQEEVNYNFKDLNLTLVFNESSFMKNDVRDIAGQSGFDMKPCSVYIPSENTFPINAIIYKEAMEDLRIKYPNTIFLTVVNDPNNPPDDEEVTEEILEDLKNDIKFYDEVGYVNFNMYVDYEWSFALIYGAPEALYVYRALVEMYKKGDHENDAENLAEVEKIINTIETRYATVKYYAEG